MFGARYPPMMQHYHSPPAQHVSPAAITPHWQQQLIKCEVRLPDSLFSDRSLNVHSLQAIRQASAPFHRARQSALATRNVTKNAITITNPNLIKVSEASEDRPPTPQEDHPSSLVAPISQASRPKSARPDNNWNSLDMGGIHIKHLPASSGLFQMDFLVNLYLNHNALTAVPSQISKLRSIEVLDLSGNALTSLPAALGMLASMKEFYIYDNHIQSLPPELGTLHLLQTLGVEGNPLDASLKKMIQTDGTRALISYLRDTCPVPTPPPARPWETPATGPGDPDPNAETFTVLCYNILSEHCARETLYGYTPAWALAWEYRKDVILTEILSHGADFLCLQEVEVAQFDEYFVKNLEPHGYEGVYWPKPRYNRLSDQDPGRRSVEGCATFFKQDKYVVVNLVFARKFLIQPLQIPAHREAFGRVPNPGNPARGLPEERRHVQPSLSEGAHRRRLFV